ncbi:hypothetical protein GQ55_2G446500 [Panicum hallii var. hallii]|uniref:Uncharacterized protein n=3 Tax=Panicum sect. Panicum TaxID=2100772 RepID=A0A3L6QR17_PANMI|nr:hypothetical protein PAHAL_2G459300 [Panicum hallii]PUZ73086.1 hypothetical protein GQ55_2G446500 [Panicum hallii var. hallii]RLM86113.1 hypothetical protein C2845_PM04G28970 [Panicum miliaceum]
MGLEMLMARDGQLPRSACRYQRLRGEIGDGEASVVRSAVMAMARRPRPLRLRRRSCKTAGMRWRAATVAGGGKALRLRLVLLLPARRLAALVAELVRRLAAAVAASAAADCPAIVFSSQWGLPVLSHSASTSRSSRLRAFYLERSLSAGSGAGSPC